MVEKLLPLQHHHHHHHHPTPRLPSPTNECSSRAPAELGELQPSSVGARRAKQELSWSSPSSPSSAGALLERAHASSSVGDGGRGVGRGSSFPTMKASRQGACGEVEDGVELMVVLMVWSFPALKNWSAGKMWGGGGWCGVDDGIDSEEDKKKKESSHVMYDRSHVIVT